MGRGFSMPAASWAGDFLCQNKDSLAVLFFLLLGHSRADVELTELLFINHAGSLAHDICSALVLRESNDIADRFPLGHQHHQTVKAEGQAAMGRRAILESVHHEAKLGVSLFLGQAQSLEDLLLQVSVVDTEAAAADFHAVEHHVVGICLDTARVAEEILDILVTGRSERMVHSLPALLFLAVLEHGEVNHPQEAELVIVDEATAASHLQTELAQSLCHHQRLVSDDQQQVTSLGASSLLDFLKSLVAVELLEGRLDALFSVLNPRSGLSEPKRRIASSQVIRRKGFSILAPIARSKSSVTMFSMSWRISSWFRKEVSISSWVNSG